MTLREAGIAGVWVASAIGVSQWTWQAYTGQYQQFPDVQSGGGGGSVQGKVTTALKKSSGQGFTGFALNPIGWLGEKAGGAIAKAIGG